MLIKEAVKGLQQVKAALAVGDFEFAAKTCEFAIADLLHQAYDQGLLVWAADFPPKSEPISPQEWARRLGLDRSAKMAEPIAPEFNIKRSPADPEKVTVEFPDGHQIDAVVIQPQGLTALEDDEVVDPESQAVYDEVMATCPDEPLSLGELTGKPRTAQAAPPILVSKEKVTEVVNAWMFHGGFTNHGLAKAMGFATWSRLRRMTDGETGNCATKYGAYLAQIMGKGIVVGPAPLQSL
jgi:hypothetical protein